MHDEMARASDARKMNPTVSELLPTDACVAGCHRWYKSHAKLGFKVTKPGEGLVLNDCGQWRPEE